MSNHIGKLIKDLFQAAKPFIGALSQETELYIKSAPAPVTPQEAMDCLKTYQGYRLHAFAENTRTYHFSVPSPYPHHEDEIVTMSEAKAKKILSTLKEGYGIFGQMGPEASHLVQTFYDTMKRMEPGEVLRHHPERHIKGSPIQAARFVV